MLVRPALSLLEASGGGDVRIQHRCDIAADLPARVSQGITWQTSAAAETTMGTLS